MTANQAASIMAKLKSIARDNKVDFNNILLLYVHERFLYRLAQAAYVDNFLLKGGLLLYSQYQYKTRPTLDIDLLGHHISNQEAMVARVVNLYAKSG